MVPTWEEVEAHPFISRSIVGTRQEGMQPKLMQTDAMRVSKIKYIHKNPVKRGYVDEAVHWRYSSARDYEGVAGLIEIERFW